MKNKPLVSICIPNYNYAQYLPQCLDSILNQTYDNIEVYFRDNHSTDNSLEIAQSYQAKFAEKGIYYNVAYNKRNYGSDKNTNLVLNDIEGEYTYVLASDDAIEPTFIERCIDVFERFPNVATVMTHRKEIDENGKIHETPPFYNTSCVIDSESQAAVYMMAGIGIPGQRMTRSAKMRPIFGYKRVFNVAGDWYENFLACMCGDVAYIKDALCLYRVHTGNETNESELRLLGSFEHYQLINSFVEISKNFGMTKPAARYEEAVHKLGDMCLRYALKMYKCNRKDIAYRYLLLAPVYKPEITAEVAYQQLLEIQKAPSDKEEIEMLAEYEKCHHLERSRSYDPPAGYVSL